MRVPNLPPLARTCAITVTVLRCMTCSGAQAGPPTVVCEEPVYSSEPANNGAGPMWCYGSTCIARVGADVFVSALETIQGAKPLNNTRWALYRRSRGAWSMVRRDEDGRTREPCPIAVTSDGRLYLSANPTLTPPDTYNGPAAPTVFRFLTRRPADRPEELSPSWPGAPSFTEHSYRGLCSDGVGRSVLLMNILGHEAQYWSLLDRDGQWSRSGRWPFPMGEDYEKPEPIRLCYPVLALKRGAAHMLAISDIIEPVRAWREFKRQVTGRDWDYEFRRLFYAWTPDIMRQGFGTAIEVASREKTCGFITNLDMWLEKPDRAHLLWLERSVTSPAVRDRFFPGTPITVSLEHAIIERGKVVSRTTLAKGGEGEAGSSPGFGRFHCTPSGRLYVLAFFSGIDEQRRPIRENRLMELRSDGSVSAVHKVPLKRPFSNFMTATEWAGSARSYLLDVLGEADGQPGLSYACIRLR